MRGTRDAESADMIEGEERCGIETASQELEPEINEEGSEDKDLCVLLLEERGDTISNASRSSSSQQLFQKAIPSSVDTFLRQYEIRKLGESGGEQRLEIGDYSFHIVSKNDIDVDESRSGGTLYRSLAQALTNEEGDYILIRQIIVKFLIESWCTYGRLLVGAYEGKMKGLSLSREGKGAGAQRAYLHGSQEMDGTVIELKAAAKIYSFNYTLIFMEDDVLRVWNCQDQETRSKAAVKYFFLRTGNGIMDWNWQYLIPYATEADKIKIPSGTYPIQILNCLPFNRGKIYFAPPDFSSHKVLESFPLVFVLEDGRFYGCLKGEETDIFSNLSLLFFQTSRMSIQVLEMIRNSEHVPNLSPQNCIRNRNQFQDLAIRIKMEPGSLEDLRMASSVFRFTYTVYGIDEKANFMKLSEIPRGFYSQSQFTYRHNQSKHFTFLTRTRKQFPVEWCVLDSIMDTVSMDAGTVEMTRAHFRTLSPLTPIHHPYTKIKKGLFGMKYRVLTKEGRKNLKCLMGYMKIDANKMSGSLKSESCVGEEDYFADFSDVSSVSFDPSRKLRNVAETPKIKEATSNNFLWKGWWKENFPFRKDRVAPQEGEEAEPEVDLPPNSISITYEEEEEELEFEIGGLTHKINLYVDE